MKLRLPFIALLLTVPALAQPAPTPADAFPPVHVQVTVGTHRAQTAGSSYRKDMTITSQITIQGSGAKPVPACEATLLIITMDTRAKYVNREEKLTVHSTETQQIPAAQNTSPRKFGFEDQQVTFDAWRDTTNVGGATYKYFVFGLRDPASGKIVDFQTNCPKLQNHIAAHPEEREQYLGLAKRADFSTDFK
jgi:hypothetical protein